MGFFSKLFGGSSTHERELEELYVNMYVSAKGLSPSEARDTVRTFIQQAKEEGQKEGSDKLPPNWGDVLLLMESTDEKIRAMLSGKRKEGVTDEDIRWAWNMSDLERRLMLKEDENSRIALLMYHLDQGVSKEEAAVEMKRVHPVYGDSSDTSKSSGNDRPLPFELKDRINRYIEMRGEQGADAYKTDLESSSSFNALVRREIRNGNL